MLNTARLSSSSPKMCHRFAPCLYSAVYNTIRGSHTRLRALLQALFTFVKFRLCTAKDLFIHSVHRVIHNFIRIKGRCFADVHNVIPIIHKLSTAFIHTIHRCGEPCGYTAQRPIPCLHMLQYCMTMHIRAFSSVNPCCNRSGLSPMRTRAKLFDRPKTGIPQRNTKSPPVQRGSDDYFSFLLPRMVASGLAACFMNAEGLMPTMFLNCFEK